MVHITKNNQGEFIGICAVRVLGNTGKGDSVQTSVAVRTLFSRFLMDLHGSVEPGSTVAEILLCNEGDRVVPYVILRQRGGEGAAVNRSLTQIQDGLLEALAGAGFQTRTLDSQQEFTGFAGSLAKTNCQSVLAVSKRELRCAEMFYTGGIYCADVIRAAGEQDVAKLASVLGRLPNSAISLQLIPTRYTQAEKDALQQAKRKLGYAVSAANSRQLNDSERMENALELYGLLERGPLFMYNFLVYSSPEGSRELAKALMDCMEGDETAQSALETVDLSTCGLRPDQRLASGAWAVSDLLIRDFRKNEIWNGDYAPADLIRLKYLMSGGEAMGVFRLPIMAVEEPEEPTVYTAAVAEELPRPPAEKPAFTTLLLGSAGEQGPVRISTEALAGNLLAAGSDRATFLMALLRQAWKVNGIPFLVVEPEGRTYRALAEDISHLRVYTPCRDQVAPFAYNPFALPVGVSVRTHAQGITEVFASVYGMSEQQEEIFSRAVLACYRCYGWKPESTREEPDAERFGLQEFILVFAKYARSAENADLCLGLLSRFKRLLGQDGPVFDTVEGVSLDELLKAPAVIELEELSCKVHKMLLIGLIAKAVSRGEENKLQRLVLLEDAHWFPAGMSFSKGTGLIYGVADGALPRHLLTAVRNQLLFRLEDADTAQTAAEAVQVHEGLLGKLEDGQAIYCGKDAAKPLPVRTIGFAPEGTVSDEEVAARAEKAEKPFRECSCCRDCCAGCDRKLRENAGFTAEQLLDEYYEDLETEQDLLRFLVQMDPILDRRGIGTGAARICVKLQLLRRAMVEGNYRFSPAEYKIILEHPAFLRTEGGRQNE